MLSNHPTLTFSKTHVHRTILKDINKQKVTHETLENSCLSMKLGMELANENEGNKSVKQNKNPFPDQTC